MYIFKPQLTRFLINIASNNAPLEKQTESTTHYLLTNLDKHDTCSAKRKL